MIKCLDVYLHADFAGQLIQDEHGHLRFRYAPSWLSSSNAKPLSYSLPLQTETFNRKQCRGFFAGLLPEERQRKVIARNLGISQRNDYAMLERIGRECAGAVTLVPEGESKPIDNKQYRALSADELAAALRNLSKQPLMVGTDNVRLSLAGAQDKMAVHVANDIISLPLDGAPSTHIIKPAIDHYEGLVFNEAFCMKLAKSLDIPTASVDIRTVEEVDYLLVARYDRHADSGAHVRRSHQEDFCQALGVVPELKYQNEGGPSLKQCYGLIREISSVPVIDIKNFLNAIIFNFLIGNNDAHGKNFSFLYDTQAGERRLAPLYDLICTVYYPELSKKMAMKIGGEYDSRKIFPKHFVKFAEEVGLAKGAVLTRVLEMAENLLAQLEVLESEHPTELSVGDCIKSRVTLLRKRFTA